MCRMLIKVICLNNIMYGLWISLPQCCQVMKNKNNVTLLKCISTVVVFVVVVVQKMTKYDVHLLLLC